MIVGLPQRDILLAVVIAILHLLPIHVAQHKQVWQSATLDSGPATIWTALAGIGHADAQRASTGARRCPRRERAMRRGVPQSNHPAAPQSQTSAPSTAQGARLCSRRHGLTSSTSAQGSGSGPCRSFRPDPPPAAAQRPWRRRLPAATAHNEKGARSTAGRQWSISRAHLSGRVCLLGEDCLARRGLPRLAACDGSSLCSPRPSVPRVCACVRVHASSCKRRPPASMSPPQALMQLPK